MSFFNRIRRSIAFKSIVVIVLLLTAFAIIISILGYRAASNSLFEQYTEDAFQVAHAAAFVIDGDKFDEIVKKEGVDLMVNESTSSGFKPS